MQDASAGRGRKALLALVPLVVAGLLYVAWREAQPPGPAPAPAPVPAAAPAATEAVAVPDAAPSPAPAPETAAAAAPATAAPGFDVVRVEPDGQAAVVGTAAPGAKVTIYADEAPLAEAEADAQGNFVAIFKVEPTPEPRALTLGAVGPEGEAATSDDVVMLLPPAPAAEPAVVAGPAPEGAEPAVVAGRAPQDARPAPAPTPGAEPVAVAPAPVVLPEGPAAQPAPQVAATAVVRGDSVTVTPTVEAPADPKAPRRVTLGAVSYTEGGEVSLAGVGTAGAVVRAYVDDSFAEEGRVAEDGRWSMRLGNVAEGIYRLRIDQLAGDGRVASRVETPFQRDYPHPPPPRPGAHPGEPGLISVTVQPGNNLWTLARTYYGEGVRYTQIFAANAAQIRDPNLIYPGQIFNVPEQPE